MPIFAADFTNIVPIFKLTPMASFTTCVKWQKKNKFYECIWENEFFYVRLQ